jgi:hypothetical protein
MSLKAPSGLEVTTYEVSGQDRTASPIISYIFWGKTLEQAMSYAKSHLKTDYFFSSTFGGQMPWVDTVLEFNYDGELLGQYQTESVDDLLDDLSHEAQKIHAKQEKAGLVKIIRLLSQ